MRRKSARRNRTAEDGARKFKIRAVAEIKADPPDYTALVITTDYPLKLRLPAAYAPDAPDPIPLQGLPGMSLWAFQRNVYEVTGSSGLSEEELLLRLKHKVFAERREVQRMRRELDALENLEKLPSARREKIPSSVRLFVWQRDQGQCVSCGSRASLEFDHIIPVADGGANSERNIQLLCQSCNRAKGKSVV